MAVMSLLSVRATGVGLIALLARTGCDADVAVRDIPSNCFVTPNAAAIDVLLDFDHYMPSRCPVTVPLSGGRRYNYEGVMRIPQGSQRDAASLTFADWNRQLIQPPTLYPWDFDPEDSQFLRAELVGNYLAGRAGVSFGQLRADFALNDVPLIDNRTARAQVDLDYVADNLAIVGPNGAQVGESFTLSADVRASGATPPMTYEWFRNGESLGPADASASSLSWGEDAVGSYLFEATVRDAAGKWERASKSVAVTYPNGCLEPPCP